MNILNIALPVPLRRTFDYLPGRADIKQLVPGMRVLVPFGKNGQKTGIIIKISGTTTIAPGKIKEIFSIIDSEPLISAADLKLLQWSADYYHHPIGEVLFNALPARLRQGKPVTTSNSFMWCLTDLGMTTSIESLRRAPKQMTLLNLFHTRAAPMTATDIEFNIPKSRAALNALHKKGFLVKIESSINTERTTKKNTSISLNNVQEQVSNRLIACLDQHLVHLIEGVTGSGKTEVYIKVIEAVIQQGQQVLVLSPEIGLTPQLIGRIDERLGMRMAILHSGLSDSERQLAWLQAKNGEVDIVIGTRSAIWTPLNNPGLFIVDEEHDLSYKQQDGLKYSARDLAVIRAKYSNCSAILGSATPSMESLKNVEAGKFVLHKIEKRAGNALKPTVEIIDLRNRAMLGAFSQVLINAIEKELSIGKQVMLFLNRRGYSPTIMCHHCAWICKCERCDTNMTYHKQRGVVSCHHCGRKQAALKTCGSCGSNELIEIGYGTERLSETLSERFPDARIARVDRDTTRNKGSMEKIIGTILDGAANIIIGTQMLAKGHHFPNLTLVGIVDIDGSLCSSDFRASERMAQLFIQVSGRAGREKSAGKVLLQTHFPDHPLLKSLIDNGYEGFSKDLLQERKLAHLPPYSFMGLLRTEAHQQKPQREFLEKVAELLNGQTGPIQVYGPYPAPIEKRAGKIRMQLLVISDSRHALNRAFRYCATTIEKMPIAKKVRWSLDIDPQDMM